MPTPSHVNEAKAAGLIPAETPPRGINPGVSPPKLRLRRVREIRAWWPETYQDTPLLLPMIGTKPASRS